MTAVKKLAQTESALRVVKSPRQDYANELVNTAWTVAHKSLWNKQVFTLKEIKSFKLLIEEFFTTQSSYEKAFTRFVQCVCLAKRYVARKSGRYISKPSIWLNIHFKFGIATVEGWLRKVEIQRELVPDYNKGILLFAKGLIRFIDNPGAFTYKRVYKSLYEEQQFNLIDLFNSAVISIQFLNS